MGKVLGLLPQNEYFLFGLRPGILQNKQKKNPTENKSDKRLTGTMVMNIKVKKRAVGTQSSIQTGRKWLLVM